ncbi:DNA-binding response regulator, partial [Rhizobium leguminosarum]
MNKVLLIDDDAEMTTLLQEYLVEEGYDVVTDTDG